MARYLGLAELGEAPTPADLLARFTPDRLPLEPTVWPPGEARTAPSKTRYLAHNRTSPDG